MGMLKNPPMEDQGDQGEGQEGPELQLASPEEMKQFEAYEKLAKSIVYGRAGEQLAQMMKTNAENRTLPQAIGLVTATAMNDIEKELGPIEDDDMGKWLAMDVAAMVAYDCERNGLAQGLTEEVTDPETGDKERMLTNAAIDQIAPTVLEMWKRTHADQVDQGQPQAPTMPAQMGVA